MNLYASVKERTIRDSSWVRRSFLTSRKPPDNKELLWELQTSAAQKFTSTRLGGNFPINNPPQWTRYADLKVSGLNSAARKQPGAGTLRGEELGMGRKYSETIDDYAQLIHMQFGVPEYNGMVSFFTSFFDGDASLLASEGRGSISYSLSNAAGTVLTIAVLVAFPWLMIGAVGINAIRFFADNSTSKYYYMRPSMELYWQRCTFIINQIAVNLGIVPRVYGGNPKDDQSSGYLPEYNQYLHEVAPDIFREEGGIDFYAVSNKAGRMQDLRYKKMLEINAKDITQEQRVAEMKTFLNQKVTDPGGVPMEQALANYHSSELGNTALRRQDPVGNRLNAGMDISALNAEKAPGNEQEVATASKLSEKDSSKMRATYSNVSDTSGNQAQQKNDGWLSRFGDAYMANRRDAHQFLTLHVNHTGQTSESFSNSVRESDISSKVNGFSSSARSARFSFSEGNTGIGIIDEVKSSIASFVSGRLDAIHMSGLMSLAGSAFADIPKHYDTSSANFPSASYTMNLKTWSGDKISQLINLYVPVTCMLAAALPLSTGKQSYTSPFLCRLYSRGRNKIQLGMITSLSITRGTGNLGWTKDGQCLGIDITFEVTNLSSIMHAPIDSGASYFDLLLKPWKKVMDEDSAFSDYMAILGNLSLQDQYYQTNKLGLNLTRKREAYATAFTPAAIANALDISWPTRYVGYAVGAFARSTERGL